jgi:CDP-4-dehydro-6-deoxyglucose reductase, E3
MLEALVGLAPSSAPASVTVLWGGRAPGDLYLDTEATPAIDRYIPVLSRADDTWEGARGHVQDVLLEERPDLGNAVVYACGSDAMIRDARQALVRAGLPERQFHSDAFVCSAHP